MLIGFPLLSGGMAWGASKVEQSRLRADLDKLEKRSERELDRIDEERRDMSRRLFHKIDEVQREMHGMSEQLARIAGELQGASRRQRLTASD